MNFASTMVAGVSSISKSAKSDSGTDVAGSLLTTLDGVALGMLTQNLPGEAGYTVESDGLTLKSAKQTADGVSTDNCGGGMMEFPGNIGESLDGQVGGTVDCAFSSQDASAFMNKPKSEVVSMGFFNGASTDPRRHLLLGGASSFITGDCDPIQFVMSHTPFEVDITTEELIGGRRRLSSSNDTDEVVIPQCTYYDEVIFLNVCS